MENITTDNTNAPIQPPVRKTMSDQVVAFQKDDSDTRNKGRIAQTKQVEQEKLEEGANRVYRKLLNPSAWDKSETYGHQIPEKEIPEKDRLEKVSVRPAPYCTALEEELFREEIERIEEYEEEYGSDHDSYDDLPIEKLVIGNWWFSTEEWPPKDYNYDQELQKRGLREVSLSRWQNEEEFDNEHRQKAFRVPLHAGLFQTTSHMIYDLRPKKHPLYDELKKKSIPELLQLYKTNILNQYAQHKAEGPKQPIQSMVEQAKIIEEQKGEEGGRPLSKRSIKVKPSRLILGAWWFNAKNWPPRDYDYQPDMKFHILALADIEEIGSQESDIRQVFEIPLHPGVFQTYYGSIYDMRPDYKHPDFEVLEPKAIDELVETLYDRMNEDAGK